MRVFDKTVIFGAIIILLIILVTDGMYINKYLFSNRLVCTSAAGDITIYYNENEIIYYTSTGVITYNIESQNSYAKKIGITAYIDNFETWYQDTMNGTCKRK
ncbi:MAG: hypothetical protein PHD02_00120 [Bacilli bacterium]|nr:hypothetical protein [Bacilli bacterium]